MLERARPVDMPTVMWRAFSKRAKVGAPPPGERVRRRHVAAGGDHADERPLPLQVDGDYIGEVLEAEFGVDPAALRVVS